MAQRMESVAPPGGVMLSASTARLVEGAAVLGEPELVHIKGADRTGAPPVGWWACGPGSPRRAVLSRLWWVGAGRWPPSRACWIVPSTATGRWSTVVGPPGIGKSRLVREVAALAAARGVEVFSTFCESHTTQSRSMWWRGCCGRPPACGVWTAQPPARGCGPRFPMPTREDLLLLDDLLGIADPDVALPKIDPDARRRRLTALVNTASLAREVPGGLRHRGRPLDRRGQRVDAGRFPHRDPADALDGADHLPPRISTVRSAGCPVRRPSPLPR